MDDVAREHRGYGSNYERNKLPVICYINYSEDEKRKEAKSKEKRLSFILRQ